MIMKTLAVLLNDAELLLYLLHKDDEHIEIRKELEHFLESEATTYNIEEFEKFIEKNKFII